MQKSYQLNIDIVTYLSTTFDQRNLSSITSSNNNKNGSDENVRSAHVFDLK